METDWTRRRMVRLGERLAHGRQTQVMKDLGGQGQKLDFRLCDGRVPEDFKIVCV
jgi:hypothetical protein